jgi:hypothetical protein
MWPKQNIQRESPSRDRAAIPAPDAIEEYSRNPVAHDLLNPLPQIGPKRRFHVGHYPAILSGVTII